MAPPAKSCKVERQWQWQWQWQCHEKDFWNFFQTFVTMTFEFFLNPLGICPSNQTGITFFHYTCKQRQTTNLNPNSMQKQTTNTNPSQCNCKYKISSPKQNADLARSISPKRRRGGTLLTPQAQTCPRCRIGQSAPRCHHLGHGENKKRFW